jgi:2-keto-4-pentenoate hydratase
MTTQLEQGVASAAAAIIRAFDGHEPTSPVREWIEPLGLAGAYRVQEEVVAYLSRGGARLTGRKIGLTARAVQAQLGVDQPDYGALLDSMEFADFEEIPWSGLIQPKVEAEIAFVLGRDLTGEGLSLADVIRAVDYAVPAIEVVDSRIRDWKISIFDTIADNASSAAYVLGGHARKIDELDLTLCGMRLDFEGEPVSTGCGAACLGNPLNAVKWLARQMVALGQPLRAGQVVLSGALGPMVPVRAGGVYEARISGLGSARAVFGR